MRIALLITGHSIAVSLIILDVIGIALNPVCGLLALPILLFGIFPIISDGLADLEIGK